MRLSFPATLIFLTFSLSTFSQVNTPEGPDLIDWHKDNARMKAAKVKEAKVYVDRGGKKVLKNLFLFDNEGYITSEITYSDTVITNRYDYEYNKDHRSYNWYRMESGKMFLAWKNVPDHNGYSIQSYYGSVSGTFESRTTYRYNYFPNGLVKSITGKMDHQNKQFHYTYDAAGRMITAKEITDDNPNWNWQYTYDSLGRLIKEYWYDEEGKDTSTVGITHWIYGSDGKILKEASLGRGYNDIDYTWTGETLSISFRQAAHFGPSYNCKMELNKENGLVKHMQKFNPEGIWIEEKWYEYVYY